MDGWLKLDNIVSSYILKTGEDDRKYETFLQYAIEGVMELRLGAMTNVETTKLSVGENNTAPLPNDYLDYLAIGVCIDGRLASLSENSNICLTGDYECGAVSREVITTTKNENGNSEYKFSYFNSINKYDFASEGGFNSAYFRIDTANRRVVLLNDSLMSGTEIILEYISANINKDTIIDKKARPALEAYIDDVSIKFNRRIPAGERQLAHRNYINERKKLRMKYYSFTARRYKDVVAKGYKQTPKR